MSVCLDLMRERLWLRPRRDCEPLACTEDPARLPEARAGLDEIVRSCRVELEHVEVAGNGEPRSRLLRYARCFTAVHVPELTVDRQEGDVERKRTQPLTETCVRRRVAGVVERPPAAVDDEANGPSGGVMVGAHSREAEPADHGALVDVDDVRDHSCALRREVSQSGRANERARLECPQRHRVEMVGVAVAGGDDVDEPEPRGVDDASRHPDVRGRRPFVLLRQRVRQVRVEQEVVVVELHEEAALTDPPEMESTRRCAFDVAEERVVRERRLDQTPTSSRTIATPRTRFASF